MLLRKGIGSPWTDGHWSWSTVTEGFADGLNPENFSSLDLVPRKKHRFIEVNRNLPATNRVSRLVCGLVWACYMQCSLLGNKGHSTRTFPQPYVKTIWDPYEPIADPNMISVVWPGLKECLDMQCTIMLGHVMHHICYCTIQSLFIGNYCTHKHVIFQQLYTILYLLVRCNFELITCRACETNVFLSLQVRGLTRLHGTRACLRVRFDIF